MPPPLTTACPGASAVAPYRHRLDTYPPPHAHAPPPAPQLYDLMTMGLKYQLIACSHSGEILDVTVNHLLTVQALVTEQSGVSAVQNAIDLVGECYGGCTPAEFRLLRQTLCEFFQDKKVKVSLFLQDKIQSSDGSMLIDTRGPLPPNVEPPGQIRYADGSTKTVALPTAASAREPRPTPPLGTNLYSSEQQQLRAAAQSAAGGAAAAAADAASGPTTIASGSTGM
eukprot:SAG22_NODE_3265_length_1821_cov_3.116144_3_plen_225_part_01